MKKILSLLIATTLMISLFVGCSKDEKNDTKKDDNKPVAEKNDDKKEADKQEDKDDKIVIAGIYKAGDQVWFIDEGAAAEEMCKKMGVDEFIYIDAKMNPETYLQAIDNVIAQEVDGVLTCIPDQQLSQVTVNKLKEAGIPVIAADDALQDEDGNKLAPWVGISAYNIGAANGEWMAKYALDNGLDKDEEAGLLLLTMDTVSSCVPRTEGEYDKFTENISDFPEDKIYRADYNGETDKGFAAASSVITANPQIKKWMVMAANDEGAVGGVRALEQAGLDKDSCVIGLGAYLAKGEFKKEYSAMKAATYFSAQAVGGDSAKFLIEHIKNGTEIPMEHAVDAIIVTKDNYKEVMGKYAE
ncbi:arabinose ABC transporter substrate-binding protein [Vallitalea guaymasensis]|uniref:arabinose ABC transporter substrate-binding protein n=1 Tax=Vallitalea guaymasensis TaxID=1185412 RepID=UPI002354E567|nr:arabinose ABC transporter substrate-binding protein [Vallitalea guaymasensis]